MSVLESSRWTRMPGMPAGAQAALIPHVAHVRMMLGHLQWRCEFREWESRVELVSVWMAGKGWDGTYLVPITLEKLGSRMSTLNTSAVAECI